MSKFIIGNVIKTKEGSIEIVYDVESDGYTRTIFIDSENSSAGHRYKTYTEKVWCDCGDVECESCSKNQPYELIVYGMEDATLVARTVKEWITKTLTKGFEF